MVTEKKKPVKSRKKAPRPVSGASRERTGSERERTGARAERSEPVPEPPPPVSDAEERLQERLRQEREAARRAELETVVKQYNDAAVDATRVLTATFDMPEVGQDFRLILARHVYEWLKRASDARTAADAGRGTTTVRVKGFPEPIEFKDWVQNAPPIAVSASFKPTGPGTGTVFVQRQHSIEV